MQHSPLSSRTTLAAVAPARGAALIGSPAVALVWRLVLVIAGITGLIVQHASSAFVFFTDQSNAILVAVFVLTVAGMLIHKRLLPFSLKGAATLYILITGLVYNILLAPTIHLKPGTTTVPFIGGTPSNDLLHILTPSMAVLDWLLFEAHLALRWRNALYWLCYPLAYLAFILIRGVLIDNHAVPAAGVRYPYFFINVDHLGYGGVTIYSVVLTVAFWLLGLLLIGTNHLLARRATAEQVG